MTRHTAYTYPCYSQTIVIRQSNTVGAATSDGCGVNRLGEKDMRQ